jgi:hypothetical protein
LTPGSEAKKGKPLVARFFAKAPDEVVLLSAGHVVCHLFHTLLNSSLMRLS